MQRIFCCCFCCWTRFCSLNFYAHSSQMAALHWERKALNNQPPSSFFFVQSIIVAKFLRFLSPHFFAIVGWFCIAHVDLCWSMICLFLDLSLIFLIASFSISRSMRIIYAEFTCTFFRLSLVEDFFNPNQKVNFQTKTNFELSDATWDDFFIC